MLGSKKEVSYSNDHTLISKGTKVVGDIHFVGELQVEGQVIGNIIAESGAGAKLVVTEHGVVEGEVNVPVAVINGNIRGDVRSNKHLELSTKSVVLGSVFYSLIEMVKGSQVNGNLVHIEESSEPAKVEKLAGKKAPESKPPQSAKAGSAPATSAS